MIHLEPLLEALEVEYREGEDKIAVQCPFASRRHFKGADSHPSAVIFLDKDELPYFCSACKTSGPLASVLLQYIQYFPDKKDQIQPFITQLKSEDVGFASLLSRLEHSLVDSPEKVVDDTNIRIFGDFMASERCVLYLQRRGVAESTGLLYRLTFDSLRSRLVFPKVVAGNSVAAVGRDITGLSNTKYFNYCATASWCGGDFVCNDSRRNLFIVEGFFDLLRCAPWAWEVNADVVCTWKANVSNGQMDFLTRADKMVYCWYDNDTAGEAGFRSAKEKLKPFCDVIRCRPITDVGDLNQTQFFSIFKKAKQHVYV